MSGAPPVILLGAQRSGTTALASVLDAAFDDAGGIFTINGRLPYLLSRWCTDEDVRGRHLRADEIVHALHRKPPYGRHSARWLDAVERVLRAAALEVADGAQRDAVTLRRRLIQEAYAAGARFGDKYNEYLLDLDALADMVPDAYWVLLLRHPADAARSMLRWSGDRPWRPSNWQAALDKWVAWHEPWMAHTRTADPKRCIVLEYSQLCAGKDLRRLSEAVDLDLTPYADVLSERSGDSDKGPLPDSVAAMWSRLLDRRGP